MAVFTLTIDSNSGVDTSALLPGSRAIAGLSGSINAAAGGGQYNYVLIDDNGQRDLSQIYQQTFLGKPDTFSFPAGDGGIAAYITSAAFNVSIDGGATYSQIAHLDIALGNNTTAIGGVPVAASLDLTPDSLLRESFRIDGGVTQFIVNGRDGADTIYGGGFADTLHGGGGADHIEGGAGADILDGGTGADTMIGGSGNDMIFVDSAGDKVFESLGQGTDRVLTSVNYTLGAGQEIELFSTNNNSGTDALNLTGNEFSQAIYGNEGANVLNGGGGTAADTLVGFGGNDWYYVNHTADRVLEAVGGGNDRVLTSVDYKLGAGQEIEILSTTNNAGTNAFHLWGNEFNNTIYGNAGANVLYGGAGNDTLVGMGGHDNFVFDTALNAATNVDTISGYTPVTGAAAETDHIYLSHGIFATAGAAGTTLSAGAFYSAAGATGGHDADDRIIYNTSNGWLSYDDDGSGAHAAVHFATISGAPALSHSDFIIL